MYAAISLTVDAWEQNYQAFHKLARSPSAYGGFAPPFLQHMMAEQAAKDVVWYRAARAAPREHLPRLFKFIEQSRWRDHAELMTAGTKSDFEARASAFLEAAEAKCLKWNGSTWLRTRYLFGTLCVEARRQWFASDLLCIMGYADQLDQHILEMATPVGRGAAGSRRTAAPTVDRPQPADDVDRELQRRLELAKADGTLAAEVALWRMDRPEVVRELLGLATCEQDAT